MRPASHPVGLPASDSRAVEALMSLRVVDGTIAAAVGTAVVHNTVAIVRGKQLIGERWDDYRPVSKWGTNGAILLMALHMSRLLPFDPLTAAANFIVERLAK